MKRKVLVTGGAGFIGSELVGQLIGQGAYVIVVDNLRNGRRENLEALPQNSYKLEVADIRDGELMATLMQGVDIVFHLACLGVRHSIHSPYENQDVNATGTLKLLLSAKESGVKRFLYVSTSEVYGLVDTVPITEKHPTRPMTVYGSSKLAGESYTRAFYHTYGYPTVVVRPFNTYGPRSHHEGDCGEVIPKFMLRCMVGQPMVIFGNGTQSRDFTYVTDTAKGIIMAGFADNTVGRTINLGSGREIVINDLARKVALIIAQKKVQVTYENSRPGDVYRLCADVTMARQLLNFKPTVALDEGLSKLRDWYLSLGQPAEVLLEQETVRNWELKLVKIDV